MSELENWSVNATVQTETSQATPACKLCSGATILKFRRSLLDGRLNGTFFECQQCHMLQSDHLDSVNEEIMEDIYQTGGKYDIGMAWRLWCVAERLLQLARLRVAR